MTTSITLTRHEFSSSKLLGLAKKERRPWIRRRIRAIALVNEGNLGREAIARKLGTDSDQVRIWINRYNVKGLAGLEDNPGKGAKRRLTARREASLKKAVQNSPRKVGVATNLWSGRAVKDYLAKRNWFKCSLAEAYVILHRLGFTIQRPNRVPIEADPLAEKRFYKDLQEKKSRMSQGYLSGRR